MTLPRYEPWKSKGDPGVRVSDIVSDIVMVSTELFSKLSMKLGEGIRIFLDGVSRAIVGALDFIWKTLTSGSIE